MFKPEISVIVPVYRVEVYLRRCVDSLLAQTFTDFEVILVDDGSPDGSGVICDEYAVGNPKVRVIHQENGGVTSARRKGVEQSLGEWITFVDSDDYLPVTALEDMYNETKSGRYDLVVARYSERKYPVEEISFELNRRYAITGKVIHCGPFARFMRKSLFDGHTLDIPRTVSKGEDMLMNIRLAFNNEKPVRLLSKKVYSYCRNMESCMSTFNNSVEYEMLFAEYRLLSVPMDERVDYAAEIISSKLNGIELICRKSRKNVWKDTDYFRQLMDEADACGYHIHAVTRAKLNASSPLIFRILKPIDKFLKIFRKRL